jgi:hypothetical protein
MTRIPTPLLLVIFTRCDASVCTYSPIHALSGARTASPSSREPELGPCPPLCRADPHKTQQRCSLVAQSRDEPRLPLQLDSDLPLHRSTLYNACRLEGVAYCCPVSSTPLLIAGRIIFLLLQYSGATGCVRF